MKNNENLKVIINNSSLELSPLKLINTYSKLGTNLTFVIDNVLETNTFFKIYDNIRKNISKDIKIIIYFNDEGYCCHYNFLKFLYPLLISDEHLILEIFKVRYDTYIKLTEIEQTSFAQNVKIVSLCYVELLENNHDFFNNFNNIFLKNAKNITSFHIKIEKLKNFSNNFLKKLTYLNKDLEKLSISVYIDRSDPTDIVFTDELLNFPKLEKLNLYTLSHDSVNLEKFEYFINSFHNLKEIYLESRNKNGTYKPMIQNICNLNFLEKIRMCIYTEEKLYNFKEFQKLKSLELLELESINFDIEDFRKHAIQLNNLKKLHITVKNKVSIL